MSEKPVSESRRDAVKLMLGAAAALPVLNLVGAGTAYAAAPPVAADDPTAIALKYNADAAKSDRAGVNRPGLPPAEQFCKTCQFSQPSPDTPNFVVCTLFPGKVVAAGGWCSSWAKKA